MTKEEKEHKDALAKADFERRMHLLQATRPPADLSLLKTVAAIRLSPSETTPEKEVVLPESSGAAAADPIASRLAWQRNLSTTGTVGSSYGQSGLRLVSPSWS